MRLSRRLAMTALSLLSAASLVACGGTSSTTTSSSAPSEAPSTTAAAGKVSGEITVLAAASLRGVFQEIGDKLKADNPDLTIKFDFQGSQDLVTSLDQGNSADVLATANNSTMTKAVEKHLVGEQTEFATNVLTLIVPKGNPKGITGLDSSLDDVDLVICAPEVPCGKASRELADAKGVTLNPVSEEQKVPDVVGKVESGEADAGLVYVTDATAAKDKVDKIDIPDNTVVNHYPIAPTAKPANPEGAKAFIDAVTGETGQKVLAKYGFGAPAGTPASGTPAAARTSNDTVAGSSPTGTSRP